MPIRPEDITPRQTEQPEVDLDALLLGAEIDPAVEVEKPPTILSIREPHGTQTVEKRLFTLGNFSCVIGKAKSKKTFLVSMLTAALIRGEYYSLIGRRPAEKPLILYFDTEQSAYDAYNVVKRIERISGSLRDFKAFKLRPFEFKQRCEIIEHAMRLYGERCCLCVIDGAADLGYGINEEEEATRVTSMLMQITDQYQCHIHTVIHQNKNDNFATGHMGSSIMKKAEIIISAERDATDRDTSIINSDYSRGVDFEAFKMVINWDGLPEIGETVGKQKKKEKRSFDNNANNQTNDRPDEPCPF